MGKMNSVLKEKGILPHATPLMNHADLVPSEMSQSQIDI